MPSPLLAIDALVSPIIIAANRARQVRDSFPEAMWKLVPSQLRVPMDALFIAVEKYDRKVGHLKDAGLM